MLDRSGLGSAASMNNDVDRHAPIQFVQFALDELHIAMTSAAAHDDPDARRRVASPAILCV